MPVFNVNGKRVLFLHVPKAGGTTIEKLFEEYPISFFSEMRPVSMKCTPQHLIYRDLKCILGENGWDYAFTIVRNPYDRVESEFRFQTDLTADRYDKVPDFSVWLDNNLSVYEKDRFLKDNHFRNQIAFAGKGVEVFRLEDGMESIVSALSERLGVNIPFDGVAMNKAQSKLPIEWDPDILLRFNDVYANDFRVLGYEKREPDVKMKQKKQ